MLPVRLRHLNVWLRLLGFFAGLQWDICLVYFDDIIVTGNSSENMLEILRKVFNKLQQAGLKFKAKKCSLFATKVKNLDHIILHEGIATDPVKIAAVSQWSTPSHVSGILILRIVQFF